MVCEWMPDGLIDIATESLEFPVIRMPVRDVTLLGLLSLIWFLTSLFYSKISSTEVTKAHFSVI